MKPINSWFAFFVLAIIAVSAFAALFSIWELRASNELLGKIAMAQPGTDLKTSKAKLGPQMYEFSDADLETMRAHGSVKDPAFYLSKKLYWFEGSAPPATALEVYTDKNDTIVYVTWQPL